ncbi:MAG: glycosyltransferase family 39 protein [Candidatus Gorgyraea atricola]|nr:glycosyltransferase family 39 protein [Candidatus Gorgyraea atricola]
MSKRTGTLFNMGFTKGRHTLGFIFLLAFIIRLLFVLQSSDIPTADAYIYDGLGLSLSQGNGYVNMYGSPHSFYPPFYPFFLSLIYAIFGHSYLAVRIIQSILGALTCVFIYSIGNRLKGSAVGVLSASVAALYFVFIKSAELLLTESFFTFLLCAIVFYILKIREKEAVLKNYAILGLLIGVSLLTKSAMMFFPLFLLPVFIDIKKDRTKKYLLMLLFFVLTVSPWLIRNYNVFHGFIGVSTQSGIGFYSSYRPPEGIFGRLATSDDPVIREAGNIASPVLRSNFLIKKTFEFISENPVEVLRLELKKILSFWAPFDWEIVGGRWFNFVYAAILPFFAVGALLSLKEFKKIYPVLLPIIYFQIVALVFYGSPRFRLPVEPYIFILATVGFLVCWRRWRV